jgi:hypothetical protein
MILFQCRCGKKLKVDDSFAGKRVKCGSCGERLVVPGGGNAPAPAAVEQPPADGLEGLAQAMKSAPRPSMIAGKRQAAPAAKSTPATSISDRVSSRRAPKESNKGFLIALGVASLVLIVVVGLMFLARGGDTPDPSAATDTAPPVVKKKPAPTPTGTAAPTSTDAPAPTPTEATAPTTT